MAMRGTLPSASEESSAGIMATTSNNSPVPLPVMEEKMRMLKADGIELGSLQLTLAVVNFIDDDDDPFSGCVQPVDDVIVQVCEACGHIHHKQQDAGLIDGDLHLAAMAFSNTSSECATKPPVSMMLKEPFQSTNL